MVVLLDSLHCKRWKWCAWHRKASVKNSSKWKVLALWSESNIQYIIVHDQDGQNNKTIWWSVLKETVNIKGKPGKVKW